MEAETSNDGPDHSTQRRQRAKQACEPCRLRKRRCYYERHPRKRSKLVEQNAIQNGIQSPSDTSPDVPRKREAPSEERDHEDISKVRSMEANSGIAFTRLLGQRLDPSSGPKIVNFGWNLGTNIYTVPSSRPITDFLGQDLMYRLATLYFENVQPLYGFLDEAWTFEQIGVRWAGSGRAQIPDHLLAMVAAMGSLFADTPQPFVPSLVDLVKSSLEGSSTMLPASLADVQSWVIRGLYLRATGHPHGVWMASCTAMHLAESVGIHQEAISQALHPALSDHLLDPELRRRTFWVARMLNTWVSFEYGRTRVAIRSITSHLPSPREGDFTAEYVNLYTLSCCLDPERPNDSPGQWEEFLRQLEAFEVHHDGIELSRANLALCGYRRLLLSNPSHSSDVRNIIINMGLKGLEAALRMAARKMPWWHVANVPFQVICIFLAMDVRESLLHVGTAMRALEQVVEKFNTATMREALKTAYFLVQLSQRRKDEDSNVLGQILRKEPVTGNSNSRNPWQPQEPKIEPVQLDFVGDTAAQATLGKFGITAKDEDWNNVFNSSDFDWNYFLTADMPTFNSFAPDGAI